MIRSIRRANCNPTKETNHKAKASTITHTHTHRMLIENVQVLTEEEQEEGGEEEDEIVKMEMMRITRFSQAAATADDELSSRLMPQIEEETRIVDRVHHQVKTRTAAARARRLFQAQRLSPFASSAMLLPMPHLVFLISMILVTSQTNLSHLPWTISRAQAADVSSNQTAQQSDLHFNSKQANQLSPQMQTTNQHQQLQQQQQNSLVSNTNTTANAQSSSNFLNRTPLMKQAPIHRLGNQQRDHLNYKTTYACEGNQMELNCQEGKLIHLVRANYGRFSLSICNELGHSNYSVQCASFRAFLFMENRCNKLSNCTVTVSEELFGDPCKGTSKYLEVQYYCDDVNNPNAGSNNRQAQQQATTNNLVISDSNNKASAPTAPSASHKSPSSSSSTNVVVGGLSSTPTSGLSDNGANNNDNVLGSDQTMMMMMKTSGNNFGDNLDQQQQQQQGQLQQSSVIFQQQQQQQQHRFCPPQFSSRNLIWNMTRAGQVARQACPDGSSGRVSWLCDFERLRFTPQLAPDFTQCRSNWLTRLNQQLDQMLELPLIKHQQQHQQQHQSLSSYEMIRQQDEQMIHSVLGELNLMARTKELFSEDLKRIDIMIGQMIAQLKSLSVLFGSSLGGQQQAVNWRQAAGGGGGGGGSGQSIHASSSPLVMNPLVSMYGELFAKLTNVISSLFDMTQRNAWLELPSFEARRKLEMRLLNHLRDAGLMLAQSLTPDQLAEMKPARQANILAGISVISNGIATGAGSSSSLDDTGTTGELNLVSSSSGNNKQQQQQQQQQQQTSSYGNQLNRLFAIADSADDQQVSGEFRLQATLLKELAANGINKFVILDVKKPDYSLIRQQLEQQQQQQQQQQAAALSSSSLSLQQNELIGGSGVNGAQQSSAFSDNNQNLAGDQAQYQSRIFGVFPTIGDTGDFFDVNHQLVDNKPELKRLADLLAQSPISVEFKLSPTIGGGGATNQPVRQCQSLSSDNNLGAIQQPAIDQITLSPTTTTTTATAYGSATSSSSSRCHLSKFNATNFVCSCDTFGFVALTQQPVPASGANSGFQLLQNDRFQWPAIPSSIYDATLAQNQLDQQQQEPRMYDQQTSTFVVNKQQQQQQQQQQLQQSYFGIVTTIFLVLGAGLLIVTIGGLVVGVALRLTSQARLSKKQRSFFESLNGATTGPLTDHNLMGSDPLVSSAATTHSASIIGLNTGASGQTCSTTTTAVGVAAAAAEGAGSNYKTHQQLYAHHHHPHSPPMLEAYGGHNNKWPARLAGWLLRRPASWVSNHLISGGHHQQQQQHLHHHHHHHQQQQVDGQLGGKAAHQMIQHRLIGGTGSTLLNQHSNGSMLAYHKSQYQNGYTTSLGLQHQIQHHQTRAQMSSTGSQSGVPLNSSSNSSYVSSSAYYEEIGPGNLTKMNTSRLATPGANVAPVNSTQAQATLVDPFKQRQHHHDTQLLANSASGQAGANQQLHHLHQQHHHQHHQHHNQQQFSHNQWQPAAGNNGTISYSTEPHTVSAVAAQSMQVQANQQQQQQQQQPQVSMITKQHLHNDLSPLQSSSSSSAGSQHSSSLATSVTTATGSNGTTPRHYLFASPSAVSAYKQQQQHLRGYHYHNQDQQ